MKVQHWIAGLQWFFFIFANIIIIPITIAEAFHLSKVETIPIIQLSFVVTGLACLLQVLIGHKRPILEGQSGLWWGIFLTLVATTSAQGMPLEVLGGSIALGVIVSGIFTILIGILGIGPVIANWFNPSVMGVFMFLLGVTLIQMFLKGMLGIPFGESDHVHINLPVSAVAIFVALIVIVISIKFPASIRSYALLIGIIIGWILYSIVFGGNHFFENESTALTMFPLGDLYWDTGIVFTTVFAGLLNTSNTFGALK